MSASSYALNDTVIIVGAGIAGLTLALCLSHKGIVSKVIERRSGPTEEGAGIQLTPNALCVLEQLDLLPTLRQSGVQPDCIHIRNGENGKILAELKLGKDFEGTHSLPYLTLLRTDLITILSEAAENDPLIQIHWNTSFLNAEQTQQGVTVQTSVDQMEGACLIGADGVWSSVQNYIKGAHKAEPTGRIAYRALGGDPTSSNVNLWIAPGGHLVSYPAGEKHPTNLVAVISANNEPVTQDYNIQANTEDLLSSYVSWSQEAQTLLKSASTWKRWPLYHIKPDGRWHDGRICLIGDAAHAMEPFLAQGAACGIEDAGTLAMLLYETLGHGETPLNAFRQFGVERRTRVNRIWHEANKNGSRYHWSGLKASCRNVAIQAMGGKSLMKRNRWVYQWRSPFKVKT